MLRWPFNHDESSRTLAAGWFPRALICTEAVADAGQTLWGTGPLILQHPEWLSFIPSKTEIHWISDDRVHDLTLADRDLIRDFAD